MRAGALREKVTFERPDTSTPDVYGNVGDGSFAVLSNTVVRGSLRETRGRERVEGGALRAPMTAVLTVRSSTLTRAFTEADRAVINGVNWNIRSITNPDMRNRWLEMVVERKVAQ